MNNPQSISSIFATGLAVCLWAGAAVAASPSTLTGWGSDFTAATNAAAAAHRPLVLFWANTGCEHCEALETGVQTAAFTQWMDESGYLFCFVLGKNGKDPDGTTVVKNFAGKAAGTANKTPSNYPYVCLYWPKASGMAAVSFTTDSAATLRSRADAFFSGYEPIPDYLGGDLAFTSEYAHARLEAEIGLTKYVDIPLVRDGASAAFTATNTLTATCGGSEMQRTTVVWQKNQAARTMRVAMPEAAKAGETITLALLDESGKTRGRVSIFLVGEQENSTKNPLFIGERTAKTLQYGEWTMDLDVAMEKYQKEPGSHLMAIASGSLWCPDCVMTDGHILETAAFKNWAAANKVILVDIDVPNFPNTTNSTCLLTKVVGRTSDGYISGRGTLAADESQRYQSGAGYLSRHTVSDADAAKVLERNRSLIGRNTLNGGWNNPDRANQNRTGIPNFFALDRNGKLVGTFETFDAIGPSEFKEAYLKRFSELIALEDADSADDLADRSWQTTTKTYDGTSTVSGAALSAIDLADTYKLAATSAAAEKQTVTVRGTAADATVTVRMMSVIGGEVKTLATATGTLADGVTISGVISSAGNYYLAISGDGSGALAADCTAASTVAEYSVVGAREPIANPYQNDWIARAYTTTLPIYGADGKTLAGSLILTLRKNRTVSAKYTNGVKTLASFTGRWSDNIAADGTAYATLEKNGYTAELAISQDGIVAAAVSDGATEFASGDCALAATYADFAGAYTVAFPQTDGTPTTEPAGAAVMTLTMAKSTTAKKKGQFRYAIYLPDGKTLSGTSNVTGLDADFGIVPILKRSGRESFSAVLKVRRNAASAASARAVIALDGTEAVWSNSTAGRSFTRRLAVYGSWYDKKASYLTGIEDESLLLALNADASVVADSARYGSFESFSGDGVGIAVTPGRIASTSKPAGFTFRVNRSTGVFSGTATTVWSDKPRVVAKYKGVLLRGWFSDCDCGEDNDDVIEMENIAFGMGYAVFMDRAGRKSLVRGFPVNIGSK